MCFQERRIVDTIERLFADRTIIVIAHRLSSVQRSEQVIIFCVFKFFVFLPSFVPFFLLCLCSDCGAGGGRHSAGARHARDAARRPERSIHQDVNKEKLLFFFFLFFSFVCFFHYINEKQQKVFDAEQTLKKIMFFLKNYFLIFFLNSFPFFFFLSFFSSLLFPFLPSFPFFFVLFFFSFLFLSFVFVGPLVSQSVLFSLHPNSLSAHFLSYGRSLCT
jgi:magnesium-transporting ATPase (P-type)